MVHESGHALRLSGVDYERILSDVPVYSHIPASVLNYNSDIEQITQEPDCSPHPFDVMALRCCTRRLGLEDGGGRVSIMRKVFHLKVILITLGCIFALAILLLVGFGFLLLTIATQLGDDPG